MKSRLARELRQVKPFDSLEEEAGLNLLRTAAFLEQAIERTLKPHGISATQYNALRILRGAGPKGLPCLAVGARMVRPEPDMTRLFDRMERRGLIARARSKEDRRVVTVRLAPAGSKLLASLDGVLEKVAKDKLGRAGRTRLRTFIQVCEAARSIPGTSKPT